MEVKSRPLTPFDDKQRAQLTFSTELIVKNRWKTLEAMKKNIIDNLIQKNSLTIQVRNMIMMLDTSCRRYMEIICSFLQTFDFDFSLLTILALALQIYHCLLHIRM